ncbi:MAG: helix-turn-helix domain-containing protein [Chloroflexota bacterium]|nr:helix-turn-helix domain-containing protein [Chloroflexota bacterium]
MQTTSFSSPNKVERYSVQRRTRQNTCFVMTPKVLLYGYISLSDGAKITYQVIDGFDWQDKATGDSKGYAYPAIDTLAAIRGVSPRTIERHISELEGAGLVRRIRRCNRPSILIIENVSVSEQAAYEADLAREYEQGNAVAVPTECGGTLRGKRENPAKEGGQGQVQAPELTDDKSVDSIAEREMTKVSLAYKEKRTTSEEKQQQQVVVERLKGLRVSQRKAEKLGRHYAVRYIEEKIRFLEWKLDGPGRGQPVADPAAWLVQAILHDYQAPTSVVPAKHKRQIRVIGFDEERNVAIVEEVEPSGCRTSSDPGSSWRV